MNQLNVLFLFFSYQHVTSDSVLYMKIITFLHVVINSVLVINVQNEFQVSFIRTWNGHKEYLIAKQIRNYILIPQRLSFV